MILAKNRESKVNIYVKENFFDNTDSPVWVTVWNAAYYLRYYLSRITVAPFEIKQAARVKVYTLTLMPTIQMTSFQ